MTYRFSNDSAKFIADTYNKTLYSKSEVTEKAANEAVRDLLKKGMPNKKPNGQYPFREYAEWLKGTYAIVEEVVNVALMNAWDANPFYQRFVDVRNLSLGDANEFLIPDNTYLTVNRFSGNHWDTDREKIAQPKGITIPTDWYYVHVYDDFERFLVGAISVQDLFDRVALSYVQFTYSLMANAFNDAATNLPPEFSFTGTLSMAKMRELIQKVRTANGYGPVAVMGTEMAMGQLYDLLGNVQFLSDNMRDSINTMGRMATWQGANLIEIPQKFVPGTFTNAVDDNRIMIIPMGADERFIKFVYEGETRALELNQQQLHDQTIDYQVQHKLGLGFVFGSLYANIQMV